MTDTIKHRIEKIRRGDVPEGYKKSKNGIVPSNWKEVRLKRMFSRITRRNTINNTNVLTISAQYGLINQEDFFSKSVAGSDKSNYFLLQQGEFAYNKSYSANYPYGAIKRLEAYSSGIISPLYICFSSTEENTCPLFYLHYFEAGKLNREIEAFAQEGARNHGLLNISVDDFFNSILLVPTELEQKRIASILTAQDKLIDLKEKRLAEKQRQKKYLMQQLLTGKKRLPNFTVPWVATSLGNLFSERKETNCENLQLLAITGTQGVIPRSELDLKDNSSEDKSKYLKICVGDIGYNTMRMWQGVSAYSNYEGIVSPAYTILKPVADIDAKYFSYLFKLPEIVFLFYRFSQGLVDDTRNLKYENFKKITVRYPSDRCEQTAIAKVLSTADREIDLLRQDIEQEKQKKKALMQLLLTGIVRVTR